MRLSVQQSNIEETNLFSNWLLDIEGKVGRANDGETTIDILNDIFINDLVDPISSLIDFVYPSILENAKNPTYFQEIVILAPKNEIVYEINNR